MAVGFHPAVTQQLAPLPAPVDKVDRAVQVDSVDYSFHTVDGMRLWCHRWNLRTTGNRAELFARLIAEADTRINSTARQ